MAFSVAWDQEILKGRKVMTHLMCIFPPGNVRREIGSIKYAFFSELGYGSCYALPEIVPLAFSDEEFPKPRSHTRSMITIPGDFCRIERVSCAGRAIYLRFGVDWTPPEYPVHNPRGGEPLFAIESGVFIGINEDSTDQSRLNSLAGLESRKELQWRGGELACVSISTPETGSWWTSVRWEVTWKIRLKAPDSPR